MCSVFSFLLGIYLNFLLKFNPQGNSIKICDLWQALSYEDSSIIHGLSILIISLYTKLQGVFSCPSILSIM
jgi:hypothetical protein